MIYLVKMMKVFCRHLYIQKSGSWRKTAEALITWKELEKGRRFLRWFFCCVFRDGILFWKSWEQGLRSFPINLTGYRKSKYIVRLWGWTAEPMTIFQNLSGWWWNWSPHWLGFRRLEDKGAEEYRIGSLCMPVRHVVTVNKEQQIHENYRRLCLLLKNSGMVLSRTQLLNQIWGYGDGKSIAQMVHISLKIKENLIEDNWSRI